MLRMRSGKRENSFGTLGAEPTLKDSYGSPGPAGGLDRCRKSDRHSIEAATGALHDAAVGVGEVVLRRGLGHTELALVALP